MMAETPSDVERYYGEYGGASFQPRNAVGATFPNPYHVSGYSMVHRRAATLAIAQNFDVGVGGCVWECGDLLRRLVLAENAQQKDHRGVPLPWNFDWTRCAVVELGAGTAIAGLAAAAAGAQAVCVTDFAHVLDAITRTNLTSNKDVHRGTAVALEWAWGNADNERAVVRWFESKAAAGATKQRPTKASKRSKGDAPNPSTLLVLGADLAYVPEVFAPLVASLHALEDAATRNGWRFAFAFAHRPRLPAAEDLLATLRDDFDEHAFVSSSALDRRYAGTKYASTTGVRVYVGRRWQHEAGAVP